MNREEAIGHLRNMKMPHDKFYEETDETNKTLIDKGNEALDMAIKALEQTRWIPVSEGLPEVCSFVNCTCHSLIDDRADWVVETIYLPQPLNSPYSDWGNIPMLNWGECEVIAWMYRDIPEPYKAESEDKE